MIYSIQYGDNLTFTTEEDMKNKLLVPAMLALVLTSCNPIHIHTVVIDDAVDATCEESGLTKGSHCSICGETIIPQEIVPALGHSFVVDEAVEPTADENGLTEGMHCERCGLITQEQEIIEKTSFFLDKTCAKKVLNESNFEIVSNGVTFAASNASHNDDSLIVLNRLGILGNINSNASLRRLIIETEDDCNDAYIFLGNSILPYKDGVKINSKTFVCDAAGYRHFTISNQSETPLTIKSVKVEYDYHSNQKEENDIPKIYINTALDGEGNNLPIDSLDEYVDSVVSVFDPDETTDIQEAKCEIRLRGNSTSKAPKKPYRLKFDKKQSFFGLTKAKNWVLLAEYMDGSSLHNYMAQKMVSCLNNFKFAFNMHHVEVFLNGEYSGLYILCENPDEKEGRLDIEQEITLDTEIENINFSLELDYRLPSEPDAVEDKTYFKVEHNDKNYFYEIKYPEIGDFPDYDKKTKNSSMFNDLVNYLKTTIKQCWEAIDSNDENTILNVFDKDSFYSFGLIDLLANEWDHGQTSFKMYKENGSKLKFGPCWDYDTVAFGFTAKGDIYDDPFAQVHTVYDNIYQPWLAKLLNTSLRGDFLNFTKNYCQTHKDELLGYLYKEYDFIDSYLIRDYYKWHNCNLSAMFENVRYIYEYFNNRINHFIGN